MAQTRIRNRSEVDDCYKWNAPSVFADKAAWETAGQQLLDKVATIQEFAGQLGAGASVLADYLELVEETETLLGKVMVYPSMAAAVDANDQEASAMLDKAHSIVGQLAAASAFMDPELIAIGQDTLSQWIKEEPRLLIMEQYLDDLFRRQRHVRSAEVEQILGLSVESFTSVNTIYQMLTSADMKFAPAVDSDGNPHDVGQGAYDSMLHLPDRELRRTAYESYTDQYLAHKHTIATTLMTKIRQDVFNMRVRGFESSLEASTFANNIPSAVFQNLIDTFQNNIPTWHKYWAVRRQALGYDELYPYDIWAPIAKESPTVSYETAVDWVCEGMKPLGDAYVQVMRKGCLEERWVDVYPNIGKRDGAFSNGHHATHPFIMMSHDDGMSGMSTLAHELGHSMHSYLSRKNQRVFYSDYSMFVAEVASNFNQAMTRKYLREAKKDDANFQIALIEEAMGNFHRYFFIMPTLARFELEIHQRAERGEGVTADDMIELMTALFQEGYGDEVIINPERVGITWATFGHLYMNYYVYQYATGISAAHALADKVQQEGGPAAKRYVEFLSTGSSQYPLDILQYAGVDMLKPEAVETTFGVLADMVDQLEKLTS